MSDIQRQEPAALERAVTRARWRILPFLILMYVLAFVDRSNVGFAKTVLQADTGLSDAAFALGAGIFFISYALCEVPSNLILYRVGARTWLSRIMVTWGIVAAAMALTHDAWSFYALRFLLGVAEAGFFPGIILYLTLWFPAAVRARTIGLFYFGLPLSLALGGPLTGLLLDTPPMFGLKPWQTMFIVEGLLASLIGIVAFFYLDDRPSKAKWLSEEERTALTEKVRSEDADRQTHGPGSLLKSFADPKVLQFCLVYFTVQMSVYGVTFYLPTRISGLMGGHVGATVGLLTAIPWAAAILMTFVMSVVADRTGKHRELGAAMLTMAALGIAASTLFSSVPLALLSFCFAAAGFVSVQPLFWSLPTGYLGGAAAAGAIGLINATGNLGGFVAPNLKTYVERVTGRADAGMLTLSVVGLLGAILLLSLGARRRSPT